MIIEKHLNITCYISNTTIYLIYINYHYLKMSYNVIDILSP